MEALQDARAALSARAGAGPNPLDVTPETIKQYPQGSYEELAADIEAEVSGFTPAGLDVREATEALALHCLETRGFSPVRFWELMHAVELDFDALYSAYVGKNVLNFFRQDNGYKDGTYVKNWAGREDNEHLVELVASLDHGSEDFADRVYQALQQRYREVVSAA